MKKKTQAEVEAAFVERGCQLLNQYVDAKTKLEAICPKGHRFSIDWSHFNGPRKQGCAECAKEIRAAKRRIPFSTVQETFKAEGYQLLATDYVSNETLMPCICPNGHKITKTWAAFNAGKRCGECMKVKRGKTRKANTAKKAYAAFEAEGYTLLDEYIDSHAPMRFICPIGHKHQISWTSFDSGCRCAYCSGYSPVTQDRVQESFEAENYTLLDKYRHKKKRLRFICPEGHKWSISWDNWNTGHRCAVCSGRVVTPNQVKESFANEGYQLLSKYRWDAAKKLKYICPEGHRHQISWSDWRNGHRCAKCFRPKLDPEFIKEYFASFGYTITSTRIKSEDKISYICPEGHEYSMTWHSFKAGSRCPECKGKIVHHKDVEAAFNADGYELLDTYTKSDVHMRYICPEGHPHSTIWDAFKQGHRCPHCAGMHPTKEQREINAIKNNVRGLIYFHLNNQGATKPMRITKFAKQVAAEIREKLGTRPGQDYHLDHIVPQTFFDFRYQHEIEACWHIENLQWLPAFDNVSKGHRLKFEDADKFSQKQLEILAIASRKPSKFNNYLAKRGIEVKALVHAVMQMELFENLDEA